MHISKNIILNRKHKKPIVIDVFYENGKTGLPIIIFCHGYKGFKDWGAWNIMAKYISQAGFCYVKFNFSHNGGTIDQPIDFPDLEAFGQNNYTKELDDLGDVIDWMELNFSHNPSIDTSKIYLIGHSRGGGISILKTAEDARISKLVTLASVCDFGKRTATIGDIEQWKQEGVKYVENGRTKQQMPHYFQFYEDFVANKKRLHIETAAKKIEVPFLIIHGDDDTSIGTDEAHALHQWNANSELIIIEDANHVFNTKHPWNNEQLSNELLQISNHIISFLNR